MLFRPVTLLGALLLLSACADGPARCSDTMWQELLQAHTLRYPSMRVEDALKLLQQAATGSEHAVTDVAAATRWMHQELSTLGGGPMDGMVDTLGSDGRYARIHLRPWRAAGGNPDTLVSAFVATAAIPPDTARLGCALEVLAQMARDYKLPWDPASVDSAVAQWSRAGYPAIHHSTAFDTTYHLAYRVVTVDRVAALLASLPGAR